MAAEPPAPLLPPPAPGPSLGSALVTVRFASGGVALERRLPEAFSVWELRQLLAAGDGSCLRGLAAAFCFGRVGLRVGWTRLFSGWRSGNGGHPFWILVGVGPHYVASIKVNLSKNSNRILGSWLKMVAIMFSGRFALVASGCGTLPFR